MSKKIIFGEIEEDFHGTPIELFKKAIELSKLDEFIVHTNNPQFIETLEVLCGADNITTIIKLDYEYIEIDDIYAVYNYVGDLYDVLNSIRFTIDLMDDDSGRDDEFIYKRLEEEIKEYELKYSKNNL